MGTQIRFSAVSRVKAGEFYCPIVFTVSHLCQSSYILFMPAHDKSPNPSAQSSRIRVIKACNACRRRKVKCDGQTICKNCDEFGLKCIYDWRSTASSSRQAIVRGHIIAACKNESNEAIHHVSSLQSSTIQSSSNQLAYPIGFFWDLIDDYCQHTLSTVPIIGRDELERLVRGMYQSSSQTAVVYAIAAQTLNLTRTRLKSPSEDVDHARRLFEMALQIRGPALTLSDISLHSVLVSVLVSMGMFADDRDEGMGFYYNQEAIAGIHALRINDSTQETSLPSDVAAQRERLYWLLFVHDRFHAISASRSGSLEPLTQLPKSSSDIPEPISGWFTQIIKLFMTVDDDFLTFHAKRDNSQVTLAWLETKQADLSDDTAGWLEYTQTFSDMQLVDLTITRYWLRTLLWQIALHKFALTSQPESQDHDLLSLDYPMRLSYTLRNLLLTKPRETVEVHGTGLVQKIFDITCTVADVLQHVVPRTDPQAWESHLDCFLSLNTFLCTMSKFYNVERNILAAKLAEVRSVFPNLTYELRFSPLPA